MFAPLFPVHLSLTGRMVVVVGAGVIGRRKASLALEAGANVRIVDPHGNPELCTNSHLSWHIEPYCRGHLVGANLIFAAATSLVNASVVADANALGLWVCDVGQSERGSFLIPSVVRAGDLTLTISTSGAAPSLTRRIKERLQREYNESFAEWVKLLSELRSEIRGSVSDFAIRRVIYEALSQWHWLDRIQQVGTDVARAEMHMVCAKLLQSESFPGPDTPSAGDSL